jgi:hypothetical protein
MNQKLTPLSGVRFSTAEASGGISTSRNRLVSTSMLPRVSALLLACLLGIFVALPSMAQVTTNSGSGLAASYTSLADAITALNAATISSPVVITLSGDETAPAGGFSITASGDATNTIIIEGSSSTITASASHTVGAINDAIFKIIGGDYITIRNFTMQENASNTVNTPAGSNTMTEFGVALFYATVTDGSQNITIHNNNISLNRTYTNTFGVYANSTHTATSMTAGASATGTTGGTSNLSITANTISNVNQGIVIIGPLAAADQNTNVVIGGSAGNANTISNFGTAVQLSSFVNVSGTMNGVLIRNTTGYTISHNTITSSSGGVTSGTLRAIFNPSNSNASTGTFTNNVNSNSIALEGGAAAVILQGINLEGSTASVTSTLNINNNNFTTLNHTSATASGAITSIINAGPHLNININSNTFTDITCKTTGGFTFISNSVTLPAGGTKNVNNNSIVTAFSKTGAGGTVILFTDNGSDPSDATNNTNNNNFSNITITGATTLTGISNTNGGSPTKNVTGNTLTNWTCGTSTVTALTTNWDQGTTTVSNNTISNISAGGVVTALSFGTSGTTTGTTNASGNVIHTITSSGASAVTGISVGGTTTTTRNIFKNKIYNLSTTSTSSGTVLGITVSSGLTTHVYNNFIGNLTASTASGTDVIRGINITSTTTSSNVNVSFNTVYINASSSGTNFGSTGIFHTASTTATTASLSMRNNIVINNSTANGTGLVVAFRRSSGAANTLNNYNSVSNNNLFYAGTPGAANLIYSDGTSSAQTMSAYKAGAFTAGTISPRDAVSFSENTTFQSTTGSSTDFLKIDVAVPTQIESGGTPISGITDDFFGTARNASTPDVGAHEEELTGLDLTPPSISYTALLNTASTTARTLSATITDPSGVPTTGAGLPVLYWNINNGTYNSATGVHQSGNTYDFTFGSGVSAGDVIRYYIVAQDEAGTPNVGAFPSSGAAGFTANPPAASTAPSTPSSYSIAQAITGTIAVGTSETYTSLTANTTGGLFKAINENVLTGNVIIEITSNLTETGAVALNQWVEEGAGNYTLTIRPADASTKVIEGSFGGGLIRLNGADRVTIDGRHGGSGRFLTFTNSNTVASSAVIQLISTGTSAGCSDVTIRNTNINGGTAAALSYGISASGASIASAGADHDNLTITDNVFGTVTTAIYANGSASTTSGGLNTLSITKNSISASNITVAALAIRVGNAIDVEVTENSVDYQTNITTTTAPQLVGISLETGVSNARVSRNDIIRLQGTSTSTGLPIIRGIVVGTGSATSNITIDNNVIRNLGASYATTNVGSNVIGIVLGAIGSGTTYATTTGDVKVYFNSINLAGNVARNTTTGVIAQAALFVGSAVTAIDLRNNAFSNSITNTDATGAAFSKSFTVYSLAANTAFNAIDYNNYYVSGSQGVLAFLGSDRTNLAEIQTGFGQNVNSITTDPSFNSATDLRPLPGAGVLGAAVVISGFTTDFAGNTRSGSTPTIGAYEQSIDLVGPSISFTALGNITSLAARTLSAQISDPSGVPTAGAGLPVLYWSINNAAGPFTAATGVHVSGNNYEFSFGAGVSLNDVVHYYIVAQDLAGTPNVSISPSAGASGFSSSPPAASTPPTTPQNYRIAQAITGTIAVGTGETYTSLTANTTEGLFKAINENVLTGNVIIEITSNLTETGAVALNQWAEEGAGNYTLTIRPADASTKVIEGSFGGGLIRLNGADRVTIDGRFSGAGQHLTFRNNSTATNTAAIQVASLGTGAGATNNTIRNSIIEAGSITVTSTFGIFTGGSSIGTAGTGADNDNLTIRDNTIRKAYYGIYAAGVASTGVMNDLTIENNTVGSSVSTDVIANRGILVSNATDVLVSGNTIFGFRTASATIQITGIEFAANVTNSKISRNEIYDLVYTSTSFRAGQGIAVSTVSAANIEISNNVIYGLGGHGSATALNNSWGIMIMSGGGINVHYNSINQTETFGNSATNIHGGIYVASGTTTLNISNNLIASQASFGTFYNIYSLAATSAYNLLDRNLYFIPGSTPASTTRHTGFLTSARTTLADWQTATSLEANSLNADPLFTGATNLRPTSGSPALGAGQVVSGITVDFLGITRSGSNPSIGAYETALINTWTGTGTWTTSSNWSLGTPAAGDNVVIGSGTVEATSAGNTINSITVNSGAAVTIPSATSLTVNGALTNNGTFTVQNGGHLLQGGSATIGGSGTFNATRNSGNTSNLVYNLWSSPNSTATLGNLGGTDWYFFNESSQAWSNTGLSGSSVMTAGRGYSSTGAGNVTFTGTFNNGAVTPAVGTSGQGWNLVGNPYPSSVSGTSFLAGNSNIDGTLWFWSQPTAATVGNSGGDYATWTTLGGTAGTAGGATPDGNIGLAQGFFVKANSGSTVSFANSMRSANAGSNFRLAGERAWFNLTGSNNLFNQILLGFSNGASDQRDAADATKLKGNTQIAFYSLLGADQLAIQAMAERGTSTRIVPVGFNVSTAGAYSLALDRTESMPANVDIFLKDNLTGSMHNLRNQAYGFAVTNAGSFTNRFEIHFGVGLATSVNSLTAENVRIFGAGQSLFVQGFAEGTVVERFEVRDAAGRLVMELNRPQNADLERMEMNVAAGVYLARIVTNNGIKTERVYLSK